MIQIDEGFGDTLKYSMYMSNILIDHLKLNCFIPKQETRYLQYLF